MTRFRSSRWFDSDDLRGFGHSREDWEGRPVIAIVNTWSDIIPCHAHFKARPERKFGRCYGWIYSDHVLQADQGCDSDFLETGFGATVPEPEIL
jgi:hypothetical protein